MCTGKRGVLRTEGTRAHEVVDKREAVAACDRKLLALAVVVEGGESQTVSCLLRCVRENRKEGGREGGRAGAEGGVIFCRCFFEEEVTQEIACCVYASAIHTAGKWTIGVR